jgi:hypothetical protein
MKCNLANVVACVDVYSVLRSCKLAIVVIITVTNQHDFVKLEKIIYYYYL